MRIQLAFWEVARWADFFIFFLFSSIEKPAPVVDGEAPAEEGEIPGPKKRGAKVVLVIDFLNAEEVDEDELFAPAEVSTLSMTSAQETEMRKTKYVLPDDVHFSSKQLLKMFMKPSFIVSWALFSFAAMVVTTW